MLACAFMNRRRCPEAQVAWTLGWRSQLAMACLPHTAESRPEAMQDSLDNPSDPGGAKQATISTDAGLSLNPLAPSRPAICDSRSQDPHGIAEMAPVAFENQVSLPVAPTVVR